MSKNLRDWLVVAVLKTVIFLGKILPWPLRIKWGAAILSRIAQIPSIAKDAIHKSTSLIYPEWSEEERKAFTKANLHHFGQNLVELYNIERFVKELPYFHPKGEGWQALNDQREQGKGAVCVSGHFGQWEAIRAHMAANGMTMAGLYKESPNQYYETMFSKALNHSGPMYHTGVRGMAGLVRELKKGKFISLLHDQKVQGAPKIPFLGHDAQTSTAAAEMALKYQVPLVPIYAIRREDGRNYDIIAEPPIPPSDALTMTRAMNDSLSAQVQQYPSQWLWIYNKRWS